jgi:5'-methylthioadenosine phosphorylase
MNCLFRKELRLLKTLIIGGTGFSEMDYLEGKQPVTTRTPFGGAVIYVGIYQGIETGFLPRHGMHHDSLAPQVNYRANVWAARELGFERVLSTSAVASLREDIHVGDLVLLDQLVDLTHDRESSFFLRSANMTDPFCNQMRQVVLDTAQQEGIALHPRATYVCFNGPRYETAAEIRLFQCWGMDVVGMTNATEAALCRELGLCYTTIALVTNMGAGISREGPDLQRHRRVTQQNLPKFKRLSLSSLAAIPVQFTCTCKS